jgi:hypothetical protein
VTTPVGPAIALAIAARGRASLASGNTPGGMSTLLSAGALSFNAAVLEALLSRGAGRAAEMPAAEVARVQFDPSPAHAPGNTAAFPDREAAVIAKEADRTSIDPALLVALRQAENGRPGREFGVLSVAADGLESQARVAATTVRNTVARFEQGGGVTLDPTTRRYTEDFLRFFSARYAPVGAPNDPSGLNRRHAANLIALYRQASGGQDDAPGAATGSGAQPETGPGGCQSGPTIRTVPEADGVRRRDGQEGSRPAGLRRPDVAHRQVGHGRRGVIPATHRRRQLKDRRQHSRVC